MTARLIHLSDPFAGEARYCDADGDNIVALAKQAGFLLRPNTVLLKPGIDLAAIDWSNVRPSQVLVPRREWDGLVLADGQSAVLINLPGGNRGGQSNPLSIIAQIALIVGASLLTAGIGGFTLAGIAVSAKTAQGLATLGIMLAGKVLLSVILPQANSSAPKQASPTYSLGGQTNQARLGQPIPELLGSFNIICDLAAIPYSVYSDNNQELRQYFVLGRGTYEIDEMRIGSNVIARWNGAALVSTDTYPEIQWEIVTPGNNITLFPPNVATSTEVSAIELIGPNQTGYGWTAWFPTNPPNTLTNLVSIDIELPQGLQHTDSDGTQASANVSFVIELQKIDDNGNPLGDPFSALTPTIKMRTPTAQRMSMDIAVAAGRYQAHAQRTDDKALGGSTQDTLVWLAMRAQLAPLDDANDVTLIAIKATATNNLNSSSSDQFNVTATRKLPVYDADTKTWSAPTATRSIAWAAAYFARKKFADSNIDLDWLAQYDAIWTTRGDYCDGVFDTPMTFLAGLQSILGAGRAQPLIALGKMIFARDEAKVIYRTGFSPLNMLPGTFNRTHQYFSENDVEALLVQYVDRRDWKQHSILCALPGSAATVDTATPKQMPMISQYDQAWREGVTQVAASHYRRIFPTFNTPLNGRVAFRGDKAKLAHWSANLGASAQAIDLKPDDNGDILTLSEPWTLDVEGDPIVIMIAPDGQVCATASVAILDDGDATDHAQVRLLSSSAPALGKYAGQEPRDWGIWEFSDGDDADDGLQKRRPQVQMGRGTQVPADVLVVSMAPAPQKQAAVNVVIDDPRVYLADNGDPPAETDPPDLAAVNDLQIVSIGTVEADGTWTLTVAGAPDATSFEYRRKALTDTAWPDPTGGEARVFNPAGDGSDVQVRGVLGANKGNWFEVVLG